MRVLFRIWGMVWLAVATSCAPAPAPDLAADGREGAKGDGLGDFYVSPADAERTAMVDRLVVRVAAEAPQTAREYVPFSHRARRWHVYHFTTYDRSPYEIGISLDDALEAESNPWRLEQSRAMRGHLAAWLFQRSSDGQWGTPIASSTDRDGHLALELEADGYAQYAVVVGPRSPDHFLPRYPGPIAQVQEISPDGEILDSLVEGQIRVDADGRHLLVLESGTEDEEAVPIVDPLPARAAGAGPDDLIGLEDDRLFIASDWLQETFFLPADADGPSGQLHLGLVEGDTYDLASVSLYELDDRDLRGEDVDEQGARIVEPSAMKDHLLLRAVDAKGSPVVERGDGGDLQRVEHPSMIAVVPEVIDDGSGTERYVELEADRDCLRERPKHPDCYEPVLDDGTPVPEEHIVYFRATHLDFDEPSRYSVSLTCRGQGCVPKARRSRYPIYFAHGFNSSHAAWDGALEMFGLEPRPSALRQGQLRLYLGEGQTEWNRWIAAGDVPPHRPLEPQSDAVDPSGYRAEHLRRNLQAFLEELGGDEGMRVNVVAHSMGGLDARTLTGMPRFNDPETCAVAQAPDSPDACFSDRGTPEPCCHQGVPWQERIASVTTLSTPHRGSAVGDWVTDMLCERGAAGLECQRVTGFFRRVANWAFRKAVDFVFGIGDAAGQELAMATIWNLSEEWSESTIQDPNDPRYTPPNAKRNYDFRCLSLPAAQCTALEWIDGRAVHRTREWFGPDNLPRPNTAEDAVFSHLLPPPSEEATIFSWGSQACPSGGQCGDILNPAMLVTYNVMVDEAQESRENLLNDGVVTSDNAVFGIYMGTRPNDHFNWNRKDEGFLSRAGRFFFGVEREPIDRFYNMWLGQLTDSGY